MGGHNKIIKGIGSSKIFPSDINLYSRDVARTVFQMGMEIDLNVINKTIINNQQFMYNETAFKRFGVNVETNMEIKGYSDSSILSYVKANVDTDAFQYVVRFDSDSYTKQTISWIINSGYSWAPNDDNYTDTITLDSKDIDGTTYTHTSHIRNFKINDVKYKVNTYNGKVTTKTENDIFYISCNNYDTGNDEWLEAPIDERLVWTFFYVHKDNTKHSLLVFREDVNSILETYSVLVIPIKKDGNWNGDDRYVSFLLNRFGLGSKGKNKNSLKDSLSNESVKDAFLTYSTNDRNGPMKPYIDSIYGQSLDNIVTVNSFVNIEYRKTGNDTAQKIIINGKSENTPIPVRDSNGDITDYSPTWIIPTKLLQRQGFIAKYNTYRDTFSLFVYSETKVHIAWYQTGIFKIVTFIASLVVAYLTGGASLALTVAIVSVAGYVLSNISPELSIVFDVVVAIATFNPSSAFSSIQNIVNTADRIFSIGSELYNYVIGGETRELASSIAEKQKDVKKIEDELAKQRLDKGLYIGASPSDIIDASYELMYNAIYTEMYNYDKFYELGDNIYA